MTPQQQEIFDLIASASPGMVTNDLIQWQIWRRHGVSPVDFHPQIAHIRESLGEDQAIFGVKSNGIRGYRLGPVEATAA